MGQLRRAGGGARRVPDRLLRGFRPEHLPRQSRWRLGDCRARPGLLRRVRLGRADARAARSDGLSATAAGAERESGPRLVAPRACRGRVLVVRGRRRRRLQAVFSLLRRAGDSRGALRRDRRVAVRGTIWLHPQARGCRPASGGSRLAAVAGRQRACVRSLARRADSGASRRRGVVEQRGFRRCLAGHGQCRNGPVLFTTADDRHVRTQRPPHRTAGRAVDGERSGGTREGRRGLRART
jgi:hypothetical protein